MNEQKQLHRKEESESITVLNNPENKVHGEITNKKNHLYDAHVKYESKPCKKTKLTADLALPSWITNHVFNKKIRIQQKESE